MTNPVALSPPAECFNSLPERYTPGMSIAPERDTRDTATHAADRLAEAIRGRAAPVCVGLDPVLSRLPGVLRGGDDLSPREAADRLHRFCEGVLEAIAPHVPCIKAQSACFERFGAAGVAVLEGVMERASQLGLITILDAKRGDIGISADHYAAAAAHLRAHWATVSPYLGREAVDPFVRQGIGVFALVRTSNPSGDELQRLPLGDGRSVAEATADCVRGWGEGTAGSGEVPLVGAVVGATRRDEAAALRARLGSAFILVPGYGAQGGGVTDVLPCFLPGGRGAVVTASRSVIYAEPAPGEAFTKAVARAAEQFARELGEATGLR